MIIQPRFIYYCVDLFLRGFDDQVRQGTQDRHSNDSQCPQGFSGWRKLLAFEPDKTQDYQYDPGDEHGQAENLHQYVTNSQSEIMHKTF